MRSTGAVLYSMRRFFNIYNSNCVHEIEFENAFNLYAKLEQTISYICFFFIKQHLGRELIYKI
jgi:hypothetical protein